jgi:hypothetical protein
MSKMGSHDPFGFLKHKLWPKKGMGVNLTIWLPTTKSWESPWFPCVQVAWHIPLERSWRRLQLSLELISIRGLKKKLWASKVARVPISEISELQLGSPKTKWHLGAGPMAKHRKYYKGEGGGFPQVRAVVSLVSSCLFVPCPGTKRVPIMH